MLDAIVVGSGPNGLAAAIVLARAGRSVLVLEAADTVGGGTRTAELTLPGYRHDVCSAIHPLVPGSPFLRSLPLEAHGLEWIEPPAALAHPFDDGTAAILERSIPLTGATLGNDARAYARLMSPLARNADTILAEILGPFRLPRHPLVLARFGLRAILPSATLARLAFDGPHARGLLGGLAAHSMLPLTRSPSAAMALVLALLAHRVGWPFPRGGSQAIADALASYLRSLGGRVETGRRVESLAELPPTRAVFADVTPRQLLRLARRPAPGRVPPSPHPLPLRAGRLQARPRPRRADSVACRRVRPGRDRPPGRDARGDRGVRGGRVQG